MVRFETLSRQQFRKYFQPSRLLLCVLPANTPSKANVITVSFNMHCSYKPPMMAFAIQNVNESYQLVRAAEEMVLAVPGESLAKQALYCGTVSMREETDKITALGLDVVASARVAVPGLAAAIANIEVRKYETVASGDHILVICEVLRFAVNTRSRELPLLSVGPDTRGYSVLAQKGIHRIGTILAKK